MKTNKKIFENTVFANAVEFLSQNYNNKVTLKMKKTTTKNTEQIKMIV